MATTEPVNQAHGAAIMETSSMAKILYTPLPAEVYKHIDSTLTYLIQEPMKYSLGITVTTIVQQMYHTPLNMLMATPPLLLIKTVILVRTANGFL